MLAVFTCPEADEATFEDTQYGRAGACRACTNEEAARIKDWQGVTLYKDHSRVAVQLGWNPLRSRYVVIGSFVKEPADARPDTSFLAGKTIPGIEHAGYVEIVVPRPTDPVLRMSDFLTTAEPEPEKPAEPDPATAFKVESATAVTYAAGDDRDAFNAYLYACPMCDFKGPTAARVERHIEMNHTAAYEEQSARMLAEQKRIREERDELERLAAAADDPPPTAPWEREALRNGS